MLINKKNRFLIVRLQSFCSVRIGADRDQPIVIASYPSLVKEKRFEILYDLSNNATASTNNSKLLERLRKEKGTAFPNLCNLCNNKSYYLRTLKEVFPLQSKYAMIFLKYDRCENSVLSLTISTIV